MKKNDPIVFIVDDDPIICQAIVWLLESVCLSTLVFHDGASFLEAYDPSSNRCGCLILDVRMPGMSGLELQQKLKARHNLLPIIMISGHGDVPMAVRALQAGAKDFVLKPFNDQVLLEKIQIAIEESLAQENFIIAKGTERIAQLSPREREVLEKVVDGRLNKQIASDLGISLSTVELHRANIMRKLEVKSLAELIRIYLTSRGLINS